MSSIFDNIATKFGIKMLTQIVVAMVLFTNLFETSIYANSINQSGAIPKTLIDMGEYSENIYDFTKAADWKNSEAKFNQLKSTAKRAHLDVKKENLDQSALDTTIDTLEKDIIARDRHASMREANQMTLIVINLTSSYPQSIPPEITKLDYYGRELEIWAAVNDIKKLHVIAQEMRRTWEGIRPLLEARGDITEAKKFENLIVQIEHAKSASDYSNLAKLVLEEVDNLENIFNTKK